VIHEDGAVAAIGKEGTAEYSNAWILADDEAALRARSIWSSRQSAIPCPWKA
jgi:hypothetical protein